MSFFARVSNLVSGFANSFIGSIERNNPHLVHEQKLIQHRKQYKRLKEAAAQYHKLELDLEEEIANASEEEQPELKKEKARIALEKNKTLKQINTTKHEITQLKMGIPTSLMENSSTAEDQLDSIRDHIEHKNLESKLFSPKKTQKQKKIVESDTESTEPQQESKPQKRTL